MIQIGRNLQDEYYGAKGARYTDNRTNYNTWLNNYPNRRFT